MRDMNSLCPIVGVVGAGAMGEGIAQVAASGGLDVIIFDTRAGAATSACENIGQRLAKKAAEGKLSESEADATKARLKAATALTDLAGCDVVIEAVVEDLNIKRMLFSQLEEIVRPDAILASNTSSIPIGAIATPLKHRKRVAGLHFFNPVPVMKLVEVIGGPETTPEVIDTLLALSKTLGRTPVVVKDTPGFLVNFGGRAFTTEALAILHENVAQPAQVDAVMRDGFGFRMGPFELMDLTGMDVNFPVTRFVHESTFGDPRLRSTPLHRYMLDTGQLGRKAGRGFYSYDRNDETPSADTVSTALPAEAVMLHGQVEALGKLLAECGARIIENDDGFMPILAAPIGEDATAYAIRNGLDYRRLICVDMVPDTRKRVTVMSAPGVDADIRASTIALFAKCRAVTVISDSPGFIGQRIAAMIANLGCEMAQTGLASVEDIDLAMCLGLNYPKGPLQLLDALGVEVVHRILSNIQDLTGDDRYRPSQWLRRRAALGLSAWQT